MTVWCWVKDLATKHRFDIPIQRLDHLEAIGAVREIPGRRRRSANPRPAKPFRPLGERASHARSGRRPAKPKG